MNKVHAIKQIVDLMNVGNNVTPDYDRIVELMNEANVLPTELALANAIEPTTFKVTRLVRLAMEWQDDHTHKVNGY